MLFMAHLFVAELRFWNRFPHTMWKIGRKIEKLTVEGVSIRIGSSQHHKKGAVTLKERVRE